MHLLKNHLVFSNIKTDKNQGLKWGQSVWRSVTATAAFIFGGPALQIRSTEQKGKMHLGDEGHHGH